MWRDCKILRRGQSSAGKVHIPAKSEEAVVEVHKLEVGRRNPEVENIHEQLTTGLGPHSVVRI